MARWLACRRLRRRRRPRRAPGTPGQPGPHAGLTSPGRWAVRAAFRPRRVAWRITYYYPGDRRIVLLTVFRKQRQNERTEVQRARWAMQRCINEQHTPDEEND